MTAKDFIISFCNYYRQTYGVSYTPNWKKDVGMVQNKLIGQYTDEQLDGMLQIGIQQYRFRWANTQYKAPTIGMFCTWLGNQALGIWDEKQKKDERIITAKIDEEYLQRLLKEFEGV